MTVCAWCRKPLGGEPRDGRPGEPRHLRVLRRAAADEEKEPRGVPPDPPCSRPGCRWRGESDHGQHDGSPRPGQGNHAGGGGAWRRRDGMHLRFPAGRLRKNPALHWLSDPDERHAHKGDGLAHCRDASVHDHPDQGGLQEARLFHQHRAAPRRRRSPDGSTT